MRKLEVIKKIIKQLCWICNGIKCKVCHNSGMWEESTYYHIYKNKQGQLICFNGDTLK